MHVITSSNKDLILNRVCLIVDLVDNRAEGINDVITGKWLVHNLGGLLGELTLARSKSNRYSKTNNPSAM